VRRLVVGPLGVDDERWRAFRVPDVAHP
jgi:hypothetical protein